MKFKIKKIPRQELFLYKKDKFFNPINIVAGCILCWGIAFNFSTKEMLPLNKYNSFNNSAILKSEPILYKKESLRIFTKIELELPLNAHENFPINEVLALKEGTKIWYIALKIKISSISHRTTDSNLWPYELINKRFSQNPIIMTAWRKGQEEEETQYY